MSDESAGNRRVFRWEDRVFSRPIAYLRDDQPMIEIDQHVAVNAASAVRLGLVTHSPWLE